MNNYLNYHPDADDRIYCEKCGLPIEELQTVAPGTEYEHEVNLCEKCFDEEVANAPEDAEII